mmetsp:Transcript_3989/g.7138  ORF Transcript_3989/g.7138 Transcript_3989/m.7138 type:complete len:87 (+) Transcript_3989:325-585(+)
MVPQTSEARGTQLSSDSWALFGFAASQQAHEQAACRGFKAWAVFARREALDAARSGSVRAPRKPSFIAIAAPLPLEVEAPTVPEGA